MGAHLTTVKAQQATALLGRRRAPRQAVVQAAAQMEALLMTLLTAAAPSPSTPTDTSFLREFAETRRYLSGRPVNIKVTPDGKSALYLRSEAKNPAQILFELD